MGRQYIMDTSIPQRISQLESNWMLMGHDRPTQWQKDPPDPKKVMRSSSYFSETTHISDQRPNKT